MLSESARTAMEELLSRTAQEQQRVRELIRQGRASEAETDPIRHLAFSIKSGASMGVAESVSGTNDFQPVSFLVDGAITRRCVARVRVDFAGASDNGTGFMISPRLFMTNQHVLQSIGHAAAAEVVFDDEESGLSGSVGKTVFTLDPESFAEFSPENALDYAIIAIGDRVSGSGKLDDMRYLPLSNDQSKHQKGMSVNIIQHPRGRPKTIAIRNNYLLDRTDTHLIYDSDTLPGASGSPLLNDRWELVGLHHYGEGDNEYEPPETRSDVSNVGIRASAIYEDLKAKSEAMVEGSAKALLVQALSLFVTLAPTPVRLERRPVAPTPSTPERESLVSRPENRMDAPDRSAQLTVPLQISVRIGDGSSRESYSTSAAANAAPRLRSLSRTPERARIDRNYENRNGFDAGFVDGLNIDLREIIAPLEDSLADLKIEGKILDYQNFSVCVHEGRRLPLITATNIDGESYVHLVRDKKKREEEREAWYIDPRLKRPADSILGDDFYRSWSSLFDRGHMTRRVDPTWGGDAGRAETDTFHFTNCTPQHFLFNQGSNFWQGLEKYVLEQGVRVIEGARISVLQGPVFSVEDLWADDVQIPSMFWKLVAWKGEGGLKAVALLGDQTPVINIPRNTQSPDRRDGHDISKFVVTVEHLMELTKLDLSAFRAIDTASGLLPTVGEKSRQITELEQIPL